MPPQRCHALLRHADVSTVQAGVSMHIRIVVCTLHTPSTAAHRCVLVTAKDCVRRCTRKRCSDAHISGVVGQNNIDTTAWLLASTGTGFQRNGPRCSSKHSVNSAVWSSLPARVQGAAATSAAIHSTSSCGRKCFQSIVRSLRRSVDSCWQPITAVNQAVVLARTQVCR